MRIQPSPSSPPSSLPPSHSPSGPSTATRLRRVRPIEVDTFERSVRAPMPGTARAGAALLSRSPTDDVVERAFQDLLGRSAGTNGFWHQFAAAKAEEGMPLDDIKATVRGHIQAGEEYQGLHATDVLVDDAFRDLLGRESGGAGFWHEFAKQKRAEGMPLDAIDAEVRMHLRASDEYQALHPEPLVPEPLVTTHGSAEDAFLRQPNGWTCAPTSLAMALEHHGLGEATPARALELAAQTGTNSSVGFPGGVALMAGTARAGGLQATSSGSTSVGDMRRELEAGRSLIVNGTHSSGVPHFLYVAGLDADGRFIVNDPASGGTQRWSDADLHAFTHRGNNPPGYAAVWS